MNEKEKSKSVGQKMDSMNAMDQGFNIITQVVNNVTGLDKGNDGKTNTKE